MIFSASEGKIPEEANASYLAALSGYFINRREMAFAQEAMGMSLGYKFDRELSKDYYGIFRSGKHLFNKPEQGSTSDFVIGSGLLIGLIALVCFITGIFSSTQLPAYSTVPARPIPTATANDCPQDEVALYFEATKLVDNQLEFTSEATHSANIAQLDLDYPPCLKELQRLTTEYYYLTWAATDAHEKGDTANSKNYILRAEAAYNKMVAEFDRLQAEYGWNAGN